MQGWESPSPGTAGSEDEEATDSDGSTDREILEFVPEECLFCRHASDSFDANMAHMQQAHSFAIPFRSSLVVDLQTVIWFLHMVIFSYRECICCGRRRRTTEAIQQHMTSTGHCRFNVSDDVSGFYDMEALAEQSAQDWDHPDAQTLRLASGKLLAHRSYVDPTPRSKLRDPSAGGPSSASALPPASGGPEQPDDGSRVLTTRDRKAEALAAQISQLRLGDQTSLVHLAPAQQRSLMVAHKKEVDKARRSERRKRSRLDHVGNKVAVHTNYYKQEVPVYMGG